MTTPTICIFLNAGSGKHDTASAPETILAAFAALGARVDLRLITDGGQIAVEVGRAADQGFSTIVAGGGDGTICAVASALRGRDVVMGILPLGTFNYFARSLDLPTEMAEAAQVIVDGHAAPLRIATINDRVFLNNASLGAYPAILETREAIYQRWGRSRIAAYWAVIKTLAKVRPPLRLRLTVNGQVRQIRSPIVFVVNNAYQLKEMSVAGADRIAAGELVAFVAPDSSRLEMIRLAIVIAMGRGLPDRTFEMFSGADILIENVGRSPKHARTVARDGEREKLSGPFRFKVVEGALRVLVPATRTDQPR